MREAKIIATMYISGILSMIILSIPILLLIDLSVLDYITLYMFSFLISGMLYYFLIKRYYQPILLTTVILVVIFIIFYVGFGINETLVFTFVAWTSISITSKSMNYFNMHCNN